MTTDELKIKLTEIKSRYYRSYLNGCEIISTDSLFISKLRKELDQLESYPHIWDISCTESFRYIRSHLEMSILSVILSNHKKGELVIRV